MSVKVKRGLGLLVVAAIAYLVLASIQGAGAPSGDTATTVWLAFSFAAGIAFVGALGAGLVLLAWGLLRD